MTSFPYPLRNGAAGWAQSWTKTAVNRMKRLVPFRVRPRTDAKIVRGGAKEFRPLSVNDFPLIVLTHDDMRFLPSFFAHYRAMGVTRFICLDDASTDGSADFITAQ